MPTITINGVPCSFTPGQTVLQVATANGIEIPQYCYHDALSIVASCRICLGEMWAPNPRAGNALEPYMGGKLMPTCQTQAVDGMVVRTDSPKSVANQKGVMEYLLINHPLDCPVCDQSGECFLQDYSYEYGRGVSRFEEQKVKQPKKDLGPHVYLYADRCIMCSRCVRFTREVTGTAELMIMGRGNKTEIDVFPGVPLDNELSANVIDLCPVGALLDKDFLFQQRVWFLRRTPSIDGITASGDNIWIEHNEGRIYRIKPRENLAVNKWWITDEVRYGWKHIHSESRLRAPMARILGRLDECEYARAYDTAISGLRAAAEGGKRVAVVISPMLACEEAYLLATLARRIDPRAILAVGPIPVHGEDRIYPTGAADDDPRAFRLYAEKAPNARGVRRVLAAFGGDILEFDAGCERLGRSDIGAIILTGNYPSVWSTPGLKSALGKPMPGRCTIVIDTLWSDLVEHADVVLPGATWAEKAGTFENARGMIQAFEQAIPSPDLAKSEGQHALDLLAEFTGEAVAPLAGVRAIIVDEQPGAVPAAVAVPVPVGRLYNAAGIRQEMATTHAALAMFASDVSLPAVEAGQEADVEMVEL